MKQHQVDMMALAREEQVVADGLLAVNALYDGGRVDPDNFYRSILTLSYRFCRLHAVDEMVRVLNLIPADYFRTVLPGQMRQDPLLADLAEKVANEVVDHDLVLPAFEIPKNTLRLPTAFS